MIDIETVGTRPGAAVIQIGAVLFDPNDKSSGRDSIMLNISLIDALLRGMRLEQGTLNWWRQQGDEARATLSEHRIYPQQEALETLTKWLATHEPHEVAQGLPRGNLQVWARGCAFDGPLLDAAFHAVGLATPWHYRHLHECRTIELLAKARDYEEDFEQVDLIRRAWGAAHTALGDAHVQASQLQWHLAWLGIEL